VQLSQKKYWWQ